MNCTASRAFSSSAFSSSVRTSSQGRLSREGRSGGGSTDTLLSATTSSLVWAWSMENHSQGLWK